MKTATYFLIMALSVFIYSCANQPSTQNQSSSEQSIIPELSGRTLHFSNSLDTMNCTLLVMEDCVRWRVHFLNDSAFVCAAYCEGDLSYWKGNYQVISNEIRLEEEERMVNCFSNWWGEEDPSTPEYTFEIDSLKSRDLVLKPQFCEDELHFSVALPEMSFGVFDSISSFDRDLAFMKKHGIWEKLK